MPSSAHAEVTQDLPSPQMKLMQTHHCAISPEGLVPDKQHHCRHSRLNAPSCCGSLMAFVLHISLPPLCHLLASDGETGPKWPPNMVAASKVYAWRGCGPLSFCPGAAMVTTALRPLQVRCCCCCCRWHACRVSGYPQGILVPHLTIHGRHTSSLYPCGEAHTQIPPDAQSSPCRHSSMAYPFSVYFLSTVDHCPLVWCWVCVVWGCWVKFSDKFLKDFFWRFLNLVKKYFVTKFIFCGWVSYYVPKLSAEASIPPSKTLTRFFRLLTIK